MKEYTVALNMVSDLSLSEDKITAFLKEKKTSISKREITGGILWCVESSFSKDAPIHKHLKKLVDLIHLERFNSNVGLFRKVYIDIAVFYDTYTCSVSLSNSCIETIAKFLPGVDMEITCYPTDLNEASG